MREGRFVVTRQQTESGALMQDVLFQTDKPTSTPGRVEFYDLCLTQECCDGEFLTEFQETHGWWDNDSKSVIIDESEESKCLTFKTFIEALDVYDRQRTLHAGSGFKHSFMWNPITGEPAFYSPVEIRRLARRKNPSMSSSVGRENPENL
jgi:hypothetical protein